MESGKAKVLIILLVLIILGAGAYLGYKIMKDKENTEPVTEGQVAIKEQPKTVQIFKGNDRPIAVIAGYTFFMLAFYKMYKFIVDFKKVFKSNNDLDDEDEY